MKLHLVYVIVLLIFCLSQNALGQKVFRLNFTTEAYKGFKKNPKVDFKDSVSAANYLKEFKNKALESGYLTASLDRVHMENKVFLVDFHLGPKFSRLNLHMKDEDLALIQKHSRLREKLITNQVFGAKEIGLFMNKIHQDLLNNGYPFAQVKLSDIQIQENTGIATLDVIQNQRLKWKEIHVKGDTAVSRNFISSLLQIKIGDWYNEGALELISNRVKQISFLSEIKPSEILFTPEGVEVFVYLQSKPMSSINGFVGLQPDPIQDRYFLTGELSLKLLNTLKTGELLDLNWQNIQTQTQQLDAQVNFPFLLKSPFGIDGKFNLYKRDSTYLQLSGKVAIQYYLKGGNFLSFFFERNSNSLLSGADNNPSFTGLSNVKTNSYGVGWNSQNIDYLPNPSQGYSIEVSSSAGQRQSQISDTVQVIKSVVFKGASILSFYIPLSKRHVIKLANRTEYLSTSEIVQNELYRFGGLNTQRGFNEQELFASTYSTFSIEYRFLLDQNSRAFLFYDHSFYESNLSSYQNDFPFGFGAGFSFGTQIGIFSIQYALGSQQNNPILIKNGKIHFGYIAYF